MDKKTAIESLEIEGVVYVPKDSIRKENVGDVKIVILQRGHVMVGRFERNGSDCKLHNASVIRIWGTTRGLGEVADGGPTSSTKLDPTNGLVEFDYLTVIATIACRGEKWEKYL
jgi:hypothetical protein